jgi:hypothetical protein
MSYLAPKWNGGGKGWYSPALKCVLAGGMRCDGRRRHRQESVHTGEGQECATDTERRKNLTWCGGSPREALDDPVLTAVAWRGVDTAMGGQQESGGADGWELSGWPLWKGAPSWVACLLAYCPRGNSGPANRGIAANRRSEQATAEMSG